MTEHPTGLDKHMQLHSEVDVNAGDGAAAGCNVVGGSDHKQLKKSRVVKVQGDGGVNKKMGKSDTKVTVDSDEGPIIAKSDDNASKKKKEDKTKNVTGDAQPSERPTFHMIEKLALKEIRFPKPYGTIEFVGCKFYTGQRVA